MAGNSSSGQRKDKLVREALMIAAQRVQNGDPEGRTKLKYAAAKVMDMACNGDIQAFKEIADRIDGRPQQSVDLTATYERPVTELLESELESIILAGRSGNGAAKEKASPPKSDIVH